MIIYLPLLPLVLHLLLPTYTHAATITSALDAPNLNLSLSLTSAPDLSNQSALQGDDWRWFCTSSERWNSPFRTTGDCLGAVQYFYHETMHDGGKKGVEFMSPGAQRRKHMRVQRTPRKYTFGTCTIAIVIVSDFPDPSALPGGFRTGPPTDTATYLGVNKIVENVVDRCVVSKGQAGWQPTGQYDGIGVFVWSTNSEQDKEIEDDRAGGVVPGGLEREGVGNGSVATT